MTEQQGQAGFTLVEVMIAFVILAIGLTGIIGANSQILRSIVGNEEWSRARILAVNHAEELASLPLDSLQGRPVHESVTVTEEAKTYEIKHWLVRTGVASDPLRVEVQVIGPNPYPVTYTTVRSFFL